MKNTHWKSLFVSLGFLPIILPNSGRAEETDSEETAPYEVIEREGAFEIRDYPDLVVARATMAAEENGRNPAFMKLFLYISGANEREQEIAMTTPVFGEESEGSETMSFVMPAKVAEAGAPAASNPEVEVTTRKAARCAVYRFSGRRTEKSESQARSRLAEWIAGREFQMMGDYETASYDPPNTPPTQRRNEVMIRIEKD